MGTQFEKTTDPISTSESNQIVAIPYPGRCTINRVSIVRIDEESISFSGPGDDAPITADFYNRSFRGPVTKAKQITKDSSTGNCLIAFWSVFAIREGDVVTVTGATVSAYNTTHRVVSVIDDYNIIIDQAYTDFDNTASVQLTIPEVEQPLYQALDTLTGDSPAEVSGLSIPYINQDPQMTRNTGFPRWLYVRLASAGTYRISVRSTMSVAGMG